MSTPNVALLKQALNHIKTHQANWVQESWITPDPICGTAHCFGGWAVVLSGYEITETGYVIADQLPDHIIQRLDPDRAGKLSDGRQWADPGDVASILLGIPMWDYCPDCLYGVHHLFCASNTLENLERIVAELCGETAEAAS